MNMKDHARSIRRLLVLSLANVAVMAVIATTTHAQKLSGRCDATAQESRNLTGSYTGNVKYAEVGLVGDATLTVTGNRFTFKSEKVERSGSIAAVTTCGYTAINLRFDDEPNDWSSISVSPGKRRGGFLLTEAPGEKQSFLFQCDCKKCAKDCDCCSGF